MPGPTRQAEEGTGPAAAVAGDLTALLCACLVALRVPVGTEVWQPARPALWRAADAVARIGKVLGAMPDGKGAELGAFLPRIGPAAPERDLRCKAALAGTLLAGLELARNGGLLLEQDRPWATIQVQHRRPDGRTQVGR